MERDHMPVSATSPALYDVALDDVASVDVATHAVDGPRSAGHVERHSQRDADVIIVPDGGNSEGSAAAQSEESPATRPSVTTARAVDIGTCADENFSTVVQVAEDEEAARNGGAGMIMEVVVDKFKCLVMWMDHSFVSSQF